MNKPITDASLLRHAQPNFKPRYGNYIGGEWVEPAAGRYF